MVIDRQSGPGRETSFANAALLTPGMAEPWNAPGSWRVLLGSLGRSNAAMQLRLQALPALAGWGITFLRNSRSQKFQHNALSNLRLALYSVERMHSVREETRIEYGRAARGTLRIFRDVTTWDQAALAAKRWSSEGLSISVLPRQAAIELEPGLAPIATQLAGALHYECDETGDAFRFCVALAHCARQQGVEFRFCTEVSALRLHGNRIAGAVTERECVVADAYIVACGSYSTPLLRRVGVHAPIRPVKGYSVTFDCHESPPPLSIPVVDDQLHAAVVPLESAIRAAGTAEFAGYDRAVQPDRIRNLAMLLKEVLPQAHFDVATARPWCGLRSMSADGVPLIGPTQIENLMVSTGHGHLGWTMAVGSAQLLTDLVSGDCPSIDPTPYNPKRFVGAD